MAESISAPKMIKYLILNYYLLKDSFGKHDERIYVNDKNNVAWHNALWNKWVDSVPCSMQGAMELGEADEGVAEYQWNLEFRSNDERNADFSVGLSPPLDFQNTQDSYSEVHHGIWQTNTFRHSIIDGRFNKSVAHKSQEIYRLQMRLNVEIPELTIVSNGKRIYRIDKSDGFKLQKLKLHLVLSNMTRAELINFSVKHKETEHDKESRHCLLM